MSIIFHLKHGIRQGGILSPILFAVYVDDALVALVNSGLGCNFFGLNFGAVMYADDILLMAGSIQNLQKLISIAEQCFTDINLKFNVNKCATMRIGKRCKLHCGHLLTLDGEIPWVSEIKYLGVIFGQAPSFRLNLHSNKVKFFSAFNNIYAKLGSFSSVDTIVVVVVVFLFSKCKKHLAGCQKNLTAIKCSADHLLQSKDSHNNQVKEK